jgi:zinc transporter 5/7
MPHNTHTRTSHVGFKASSSRPLSTPRDLSAEPQTGADTHTHTHTHTHTRTHAHAARIARTQVKSPVSLHPHDLQEPQTGAHTHTHTHTASHARTHAHTHTLLCGQFSSRPLHPHDRQEFQTARLHYHTRIAHTHARTHTHTHTHTHVGFVLSRPLHPMIFKSFSPNWRSHIDTRASRIARMYAG